MTRLAQGLKLAREEQRDVPVMRLDVVDDGGDNGTRAQGTERMRGEL